MIYLNPEQIDNLLEIIKDPKGKEAVKSHLRELVNPTFDSSKPVQSSLKQKRHAKKALDVICRIAVKIAEHKLFSDLLDSMD
jgi:hypothetical protein